MPQPVVFICYFGSSSVTDGRIFYFQIATTINFLTIQDKASDPWEEFSIFAYLVLFESEGQASFKEKAIF